MWVCSFHAAAAADTLASFSLLIPPAFRNPNQRLRAAPRARATTRRIILHAGPTNSGKTHAALARFLAARSALYCSPLRLLAWEVSERVNAAGVACDLVTGQEVRRLPGAQHCATTVEMADTSRPVDVAVVDEVQMMADPTRGWAFTRALLGLPAAELHLCGDPAALDLARRPARL